MASEIAPADRGGEEENAQTGKRKKTRDSEYRKLRQEARRLAREGGEKAVEGGACKSKHEREKTHGTERAAASGTKGDHVGEARTEKRDDEANGAREGEERKRKRERGREAEKEGEKREEPVEGDDGDAGTRLGRKRKRRRRRKNLTEDEDTLAHEENGDEAEDEKADRERQEALPNEEGKRHRKRHMKRKGTRNTEEQSRDEEGQDGEDANGDSEETDAAQKDSKETPDSQDPSSPSSASSSSASSSASSSSSSSSSSPSCAGKERTPRPEFTSRYCVVTQHSAGEEEDEKQAQSLRALHPCVVDALRRRNIQSLFPVQRTVVHFLTRCIDRPYDAQNCDLCVSAPTGEGKTFCYVLPIVSFLLGSVVRTTRCVVLVPTRELAMQVAEEFRRFRHFHPSPFVSRPGSCRTSSSSVRHADAEENERSDAADEHAGKRGRKKPESDTGLDGVNTTPLDSTGICDSKTTLGNQVVFCRDISVVCLVGELPVHRNKRGNGSAGGSNSSGTRFASPLNSDFLASFLGSSHAPEATSGVSIAGSASPDSAAPPDVVVCTPGKFSEMVWNATRRNGGAFSFDAVRGEDGLSLQDEDALQAGDMRLSLDDVQWLVIDEADRLVRQPHHDWMKAVEALQRLRFEACRTRGRSFASRSPGKVAIPCVSAFASPFVASASLPLQKLTFSATMTKNPKSLALLNLTRPFFVLSTPSGHYSMPQSLAQRYVVCDSEDKPLCLLLLLLRLARHLANGGSELGRNRAAVQAASNDSNASGDEAKGQEAGGSEDEEEEKEEKAEEENAEEEKAEEENAEEENAEEENEEEEKAEEGEEKEESDDGEEGGEEAEGGESREGEGECGEEPEEGGVSEKRKKMKVLVFCSSRDATHRLARLLQLYFEHADSSQIRPTSISRFAAFSSSEGQSVPAPSRPDAANGAWRPGDACKEEEEEVERPLCLRVRELSSNLSQRDRMKLINGFKNGTVEVLVCSDLASRGLDVEGVDAVFHYDAPQHVQAYVHRSGRSAR
ncbi:putative helicase [Neospora caninum Liverpool]|nr:putative helicase [Neospora caninum Liverpool]CBZ50691.1 putative helicase [Neospora caninum Liverpool]|eukprot:XP_003880724.1 putative helicase [Neospora caninum Liverpool]